MAHTKPCSQCPWRLANQGKRSPGGFYTKANLRRLWNQVRNGGRRQSCHLTDPSHPDHRAAGAPENAKVQECPGSVILVKRELMKMANESGVITSSGLANYKRIHMKKGLTIQGVRYWVIDRIAFANAPAIMGGDGPLPEVDVHDPEIGLPDSLA